MFRFRNLFLILGSALILAALFFTDPEKENLSKALSTSMLLLALGSGVLAVAAAHLARKALFDYINMKVLAIKAYESPIGAAIVFLGVCIVLYGLLGLFGSKLRAAEIIPSNAKIYAPVLKAEQVKFWGNHPRPELLAGLIEQESCVTLHSQKCWSPKAQLKTSREEGAGFGQITRAYTKSGALRFDSLADMRDRYADLSAWSWSNVYQRADLQLRAIVLMSRENYQTIHRFVANPQAALAFADAAYNGGMTGVQRDRRLCGLKPNCDPQQWFNHVELTCTKSHSALYGNRSACQINREHVRNVMLKRSAKYRSLMA